MAEVIRTSKLIPFADWQPDAPTLGASQVVRNVVPGEKSYRPLPQFEPLNESAQAIPEGFTASFVALAGDGYIDVIAATDTVLWRWNGSAWVTINSGFTSGDWSFAQWGNEIVAVNESDGGWVAPIGGTFAHDPNIPPARFVARVGSRLMVGALATDPNAVQWSGFNDRLTWGIADIASGADIQYMPREYGVVTGIRGGSVKNAVIFQERAISTLEREQTFIYSIDQVEEEFGCAASRSIQTYGRLTFFVSQEGPAVFDGQSVRLLGDGRFRRWFIKAARGVTMRPIHSAIDKEGKFVLWSWIPDDGSLPAQGLIYNWAEDRAAEWRPDVAYPVIMNLPASIAADSAITQLTIGAYTGSTLETRVSAEPDRPRIDENILVIGAIDPDTSKLGKLTGLPMEAYLETAEWMAEPTGKTAPSPRTLVTKANVLGNASPTEINGKLFSRQDSPGDAIEETGDVPGHPRGSIAVMGSGKSHKLGLRIKKASNWEHIQGVQFTYSEEGED